MIILNNGHTPLSPGGVSGGRTEYRENKRLIEAISERLSGCDIKITEGTKGYSDNGLLFVFHKGTSMKNAPKRGAEIFVGKESSADTQYRAYRLLSSICPVNGYRYRGVHTLTAKSPFKSLAALNNENAYLIKAGYIDSEGDNETSDREFSRIAAALAGEIMRIYKENINENYS